MMNKEQKKEQDILFKEEDDWITYIKENEYDIIICRSATEESCAIL